MNARTSDAEPPGIISIFINFIYLSFYYKLYLDACLADYDQKLKFVRKLHARQLGILNVKFINSTGVSEDMFNYEHFSPYLCNGLNER